MTRKQQLLQTLKNQMAELNRIWEQQELKLSDSDYIKRYDSLQESIKELEGWK